MENITSLDGTLIGFQRSGAGPSLLLVHGGTADHTRWSSILPKFEQHFTVYVMDRRGRGWSGDSPDYHWMREAEDVAAMVDTIGEPTYLLGHSFGGLCSLEASLLTSKVRKLILYEPPLPSGMPMYAPDLPDHIKALIDRGEFEEALVLFIREEVKMPDHELAIYRQLPMWKERVKIVPTVLREMVIDRTYKFDPARFSNLQVPTLLLLGGDSPAIFQRAIKLLHATLPASQIVILPGQQHIAMDTAPEMFINEVLHFLEDN